MAIMALYSAASGLKALSTQLDVISNNIANVNNNGFKSSRVTFEDVFYQYQQYPGVQNTQNDIRPIGLAVGLGTRISGTQLDMSQGSTIQTGRDLDVAIEGDGFFQVKVLANQGDGLAYTRTGAFMVDANGNLVLNSGNGYKLDPPITIPNNTTKVDISQDGRVFATVAGNTTPQQVGQMQLARFVNPQGLVQIGGNLYQKSDASGAPTLANPGTDGLGTLQQGSLEASNVDPVKELVSLIQTQRAFELNSQAIQAADQMLQQISNMRR
jgi:flagellar basal-body rod protein FlgG